MIYIIIITILVLLLLIIVLYYIKIRDVYIFTKEVLYSSSNNKLEELLKIAKTIPYYKYKIKDNFDEIEPTTKSDIINNLELTILPYTLYEWEIREHISNDFKLYLEKNNNKYVISTTSGTTGEVGIFINDYTSWIKVQAILFNEFFYNNIPKFIFNMSAVIKIVFITYTNCHCMTRKICEPFIKTININILIIDANDNLISEKINNFKPHIMHVYPCIIDQILYKIDIPDPISITTGTERLSLIIRRKLENKFNSTRIIETYGCTECPLIGSSCNHGNIHVNDNCILELVDKNNNIIKDKYVISDHILITNLINTYQPIIRYVISDSVQYIDCPCRSNRTAIKIHGRTDDNIYMIDKNDNIIKITPLMLESLLVTIPYQFTYQIVQEKLNYLIIYVITLHQDILSCMIKDVLNECIDTFNLKGFEYDIIFTDKLNQDSKKFKQIISKVKHDFNNTINTLT